MGVSMCAAGAAARGGGRCPATACWALGAGERAAMGEGGCVR